MNGLEVIYEKSRWKIQLSKEVFVDLIEIHQNFGRENEGEFTLFVSNHKIGEALKTSAMIGLTQLNLHLTVPQPTYIKLYKEYKSSFTPDEIFQIGRTILEIDELSEAGIGLVVRSQKMKGNINGYHREYELFKKKYFDLTGENFEKSAEKLEKIKI
ncbi:MAG: hypothetical protein U5K00_17235 [Melioribacteraceae bacterium]|nr:hypothetical protein [Melioribacteraceae bacterium]